MSLGEMLNQFKPLAFAAGQSIDGLAKPQVTEAQLLQKRQAFRRLSRGPDFQEAVQELNGFIHSSFQQIGNTPCASGAGDRHLKNVRTVAAAIALGAPNKNIAQKLHLDFFKSRAATTLALALG